MRKNILRITFILVLATKKKILKKKPVFSSLFSI